MARCGSGCAKRELIFSRAVSRAGSLLETHTCTHMCMHTHTQCFLQIWLDTFLDPHLNLLNQIERDTLLGSIHVLSFNCNTILLSTTTNVNTTQHQFLSTLFVFSAELNKNLLCLLNKK